MQQIKLATVRLTGKRYIVIRQSFGRKGSSEVDKVFCWGELVSYKAAGEQVTGIALHDGQQTFLLSEVQLSEVARSARLYKELFDQMIESRREAGHLLAIRSGRKHQHVVDYGTREMIESRAEVAHVSDSLKAALRRAGL